jgi:hypothetical protein
MQVILGEPLSASPENSDSESDSGSDSTLEDLDLYPTWAHGYPLQRVVGFGLLDRMSGRVSLSPSSSRGSDSSSTSSVVYDMYV